MSAAEEKQAADIVKIRLKDGIADYFIILSCKNERQIKSVVNEIEKQIREQFSRKPFHIDGMPECEWVVMDYGDVIVHAFLNDLRDLYDLESLWGEKKDQIRKRRIRTAFDDEDEI
ncbi:MAG: ribosome silencing factor [Candidatus Aureabacteria bacterium]|nr:ribosome silencing factor [Candidatus Auribacterota bacterium]